MFLSGFGFSTGLDLVSSLGFLANISAIMVGCPPSFKFFFPFWFGFPTLVWFGVVGFGFGCCWGFPPSFTNPFPLSWFNSFCGWFPSNALGLVSCSPLNFTGSWFLVWFWYYGFWLVYEGGGFILNQILKPILNPNIEPNIEPNSEPIIEPQY